MEALRQSFRSPDPFYRGTDLWMLNGKLTDEELVRQIHEFHDKGFYSFIARTYNGLESDYPGPDWMSKIATIIRTAKDLGMKVVLQAGYMPAAVVGLPPEYALHYVEIVSEDKADGTEKPLALHNGVIYADRTYPAAINLFSPEAVRWYANLCYTDMWKEFREEFGKTVISVWVDEPRFDPKWLPWSPTFPDAYKKRWNEDLMPLIHQLFVDEGDFKRTRYRFRVMMQQAMADAYYKQVSAVCHSLGLMMSGHLMSEESTHWAMENAVCTMPYYKYFDIPGIDFLGSQLNWSYDASGFWSHEHDRYFMTPLQAESAVRQAGKESFLCEMYGVSSSNLTFRSQKHIFDWFAAFGVNHRCCHAYFYSIAGFRKRFYPHQLNYCEPYWDKVGLVNDYVARVSQFVSFGKPQGDLLLIHPAETTFMNHVGGSLQKDENAAVIAADRRTNALIDKLFFSGRPFEFGDMMTIREEGAVTADGFRIGAMTYRTVVLPYLETLNTETFRLLKEYRVKGGRVIVLGTVPDRLEGETDAGMRAELAGWEFAEDAADLLRLLRGTDARFTLTAEDPSGIIVHRRAEEDGSAEYYMLTSFDCGSARAAQLHVGGKFNVCTWHAEDGTITRCDSVFENGGTTAFFTIPEGGSVLLSFEKDAEISDLPPVREAETSIPLGGGWEAQRMNGNLLMLDICRLKREGETELSAPVAVTGVNDLLNSEKYTGMLDIAFDFTAEADMNGLSLVLEEPEAQEITLNEIPVTNKAAGEFYAKDFAVVPLPPIRAGRNRLMLRRRFIPAAAASGNHLLELFVNGKGSEIEPVYLCGAFRVVTMPECSRTGYVQTSPEFSIAPEAERVVTDGSFARDGYPFYVGELRLHKTLTLTEAERKFASVRLSIGELHAATAEIFVNGRSAGNLSWAPLEKEIAPLLVTGENTFEIRLLSTLRNMIGPHHFQTQDGRMLDCGIGSIAWWKTFEPRWMTDPDGVYARWNKSYCFVDYGVKDVKLVCR